MPFLIKNKFFLLFIATIFCGLLGVGIYLKFNYEYKAQRIESIELFCNKSEVQRAYIYAHIKEGSATEYNYKRKYRPITGSDSSFLFKVDDGVSVRNLRLYIKENYEEVLVSKIVAHSKDFSEEVNLKELNLNGDMSYSPNQEKLKVELHTKRSFLEIKKTFIYPEDLKPIAIAFVITFVCLVLFFLIINNLKIDFKLGEKKFTELSVIIFLASIFMPHPIFNIGLMFSLLFVLKEFRFRRLFSNKINIIFIVYFFVLFLNDLFVSASSYHNLKATETYLPFLILPIYVSCIKDSKALRTLPFFAILLGFGLFLTSILNVAIFKNLDYLSFVEFTKFTHPVYYSYLVSFSIFYLFLYSKMENLHKNIGQVLLFFFLILAGSKLVITITIIIYIGLIIKNKKALLMVIGGLVVLALFPPVQKRFDEILNLNDLSIVSEKVIAESSDSRINGLTLRFLLWQESVKSINTIPEYMLGLGVGGSTNEILKENLKNRGLSSYKQYSTHNQFVNVFMRAGLVGILSLLMIIIYGFYKAIKSKNKMLLIMVIMFMFAMLTESVFQRILGIYFFTTILLFLMKSIFLNEDSNNWN